MTGYAVCTDKRYILAPGTQVREEDFGLLFYTMQGPRLFFLSLGELLECSFFRGDQTLDQWLEQHSVNPSIHKLRVLNLAMTLDRLKEKGVILER